MTGKSSSVSLWGLALVAGLIPLLTIHATFAVWVLEGMCRSAYPIGTGARASAARRARVPPTAFEWILALLINLHALWLAWLWRKSRFRMRLWAG